MILLFRHPHSIDQIIQTGYFLFFIVDLIQQRLPVSFQKRDPLILFIIAGIRKELLSSFCFDT